MECENCKSSGLGFCFDHIPAVQLKKDPPKYDELMEIVSRLVNHEGTKWLKVPCPHDVLGCNFCGEEYRKHSEDCLILKAEKLMSR